ncbi:MAG: hypothetical protein R3C32_01810 [Chloroflexota bacterium]
MAELEQVASGGLAPADVVTHDVGSLLTAGACASTTTTGMAAADESRWTSSRRGAR